MERTAIGLSHIGVKSIMADFWVSQQRHWCKYCKKFIANNKPSIQIHESGRSHKDQVERFLRDVYKQGRQEKKEAESIRRELQRVEKAALNAFHSKDLARSETPPLAPTPSYSPYGPKPSTSSSATALPPRPRQPPPAPPSTSSSSSTSASQSYIPPPLEVLADTSSTTKLEGRDEWAIPQAIAAPGEWRSVTPPPKPEKPEKEAAAAEDGQSNTTHDNAPGLNDDDDQEDAEDLRNFKIQEKEYPTENMVDPSGDQDESVTSDSLFKKRKIGQQNSSTAKKRNIRKK